MTEERSKRREFLPLAFIVNYALITLHYAPINFLKLIELKFEKQM